MNAWSRMRKRLVLLIVFVATVILVGLPAYFLFYQAPSCSDGVKNGSETGVDCGGSCRTLCTVESLPLLVKGDPRVLRVSDGSYEVVALLENPNTDASIRRARYSFRVYSAQSLVPIMTIEGETYVPRGQTFAIFEGPFDFSNLDVPSRAIIEWDTSSLIWEKEESLEPELLVEGLSFSRRETLPRLETNLRNNSLVDAYNIELIALLYNETGSIFAASKTFIEALPAGGEALAIFSWPEPLAAEPVETKILLKILPDQSYLR